MKLLIIQFSPVSYFFLRLRFKFDFQHPPLKHPRSVFFARLETKFHSRKRQETKLKFYIFQDLRFFMAEGKTQDFENLLFFSILIQL
jgi:hypothetical protein